MEQLQQSASFSIFYDAVNSDFTNHSVDAETLGRSLSAMSKLVQETDRVVNGEATSRLIVTAPPRPGSLGIDFALLSHIADVAYLLKVLGFAGAGTAVVGPSLVELTRQLGKKRILRSEVREDGVAVLTYEDGEEQTQVECNKAVAALVAEPEIRKALIETIQAPLNGLEERTFRVESEDGDVLLMLDDEDIEEILPLPSRTLETVEENRRRMEIYFVRVNFDSPSAGWRAKWMDDEFAVKIDDAVFFNRVRGNQASFSKDTLFVVDMVIRTVDNARGRKISYKVVEVLRRRN
ncbi:hypothetical protein AAEH73_10195 [Shewanella algae]|uniref:hypothetical protein n=1 Tax=Shewanella algae TaxID=38313 RepID=UPI00313D9EFC